MLPQTLRGGRVDAYPILSSGLLGLHVSRCFSAWLAQPGTRQAAEGVHAPEKQSAIVVVAQRLQFFSGVGIRSFTQISLGTCVVQVSWTLAAASGVYTYIHVYRACVHIGRESSSMLEVTATQQTQQACGRAIVLQCGYSQFGLQAAACQMKTCAAIACIIV